MKLPCSLLTLCIAVVLLAARTAGAQTPPFARASIPDKSEVWVGQRVGVVVDLVAPGVFSGSPVYQLPEPKGALLLPSAGRAVLSNETIGDKDCTVLRHELSVFARQSGTITIPPCKVRIGFKPSFLDKNPTFAEITTPPVTFTVKTPPGAEKLGSIISAENLTVVESWTPEPGKTKAKIGDAFTRTITFSAPGIPAMAFPPFPVPQVDGLGFYPKEPEVAEHEERGETLSERRDTVTCICRRAGSFVIPAVRLTWFDLGAKKLRTIDFPARTLEVAPNPAAPAASSPASEAPARREPGILDFLLQVILPLSLIIALVRWKGPAVAQFLRYTFRSVHLSPLNPGTPDGQFHDP